MSAYLKTRLTVDDPHSPELSYMEATVLLRGSRTVIQISRLCELSALMAPLKVSWDLDGKAWTLHPRPA